MQSVGFAFGILDRATIQPIPNWLLKLENNGLSSSEIGIVRDQPT